MNNVVRQIEDFTNINLGNVRVVVVDNEIEKDKVYFSAVDVAKVLGMNPNSATFHFKESFDKLTTPRQTRDRYYSYIETPVMTGNGTVRELNLMYLTEIGLYRVVLRSDKPEALEFQDWIIDDILPKLRVVGKSRSEELLRGEIERLQMENQVYKEGLKTWNIKLMAKDSESVCTTAWVVYNPNLSPQQKLEAMKFDPGDGFDFVEMRHDMRGIEDGTNYYPKLKLHPDGGYISPDILSFFTNNGLEM